MAGYKADRLECLSGLIKRRHANDAHQPRTTPANVRDKFVAFLTNRPIAGIDRRHRDRLPHGVAGRDMDCDPHRPGDRSPARVESALFVLEWRLEDRPPAFVDDALSCPMVVKPCHHSLYVRG